MLTIKSFKIITSLSQINGNRTAITSNDLVEGTLGKFGIICVEDLIHEVIYCSI